MCTVCGYTFNKYLIWYGVQEFIPVKNHMCLQCMVINLIKNIIWYSMQEFIPVKNHMCVQCMVINLLKKLAW